MTDLRTPSQQAAYDWAMVRLLERVAPFTKMFDQSGWDSVPETNPPMQGQEQMMADSGSSLALQKALLPVREYQEQFEQAAQAASNGEISIQQKQYADWTKVMQLQGMAVTAEQVQWLTDALGGSIETRANLIIKSDGVYDFDKDLRQQWARGNRSRPRWDVACEAVE